MPVLLLAEMCGPSVGKTRCTTMKDKCSLLTNLLGFEWNDPAIEKCGELHVVSGVGEET